MRQQTIGLTLRHKTTGKIATLAVTISSEDMEADAHNAYVTAIQYMLGMVEGKQPLGLQHIYVTPVRNNAQEPSLN